MRYGSKTVVHRGHRTVLCLEFVWQSRVNEHWKNYIICINALVVYCNETLDILHEIKCNSRLDALFVSWRPARHLYCSTRSQHIDSIYLIFGKNWPCFDTIILLHLTLYWGAGDFSTKSPFNKIQIQTFWLFKCNEQKGWYTALGGQKWWPLSHFISICNMRTGSGQVDLCVGWGTVQTTLGKG